MKEYTLLAVVSVALTVYCDARTRMRLLRQPLFYLFLFIIFLFTCAVNGYLTGSGIVIYNSRFFMGLRLGSIPVEDFLFGFSMVTITITLWEYFKGKV